MTTEIPGQARNEEEEGPEGGAQEGTKKAGILSSEAEGRHRGFGGLGPQWVEDDKSLPRGEGFREGVT